MAQFTDLIDPDHCTRRRDPMDVRMTSREDFSTGFALTAGNPPDPFIGPGADRFVREPPAIARHGEHQGRRSLADAFSPRKEQSVRDPSLPKKDGEHVNRLLIPQNLNIER